MRKSLNRTEPHVVEPHPAIARHEELMAVLDRIARALEAQVPGEYYGAVK
jgi:hypothetical protein